MMRALKTLTVFLLAAVILNAQDQQVIYTGGVPKTSTIPTGCSNGLAYDGSTLGCAAGTTWIPSGMIAFISTGSCPSGWTQISGAGDYILLTAAANGDVGTTGGSNSYTPAGTVAAPIFSGSSGTTSAVSAGTPAGTNGTVTTGATSGGTPAGTIGALTTGPDSSTTGGVAKAIAQTPTFTGSNLATHTHSVPAEPFTGSALGTHTHTMTPTGTNSVPAFSGTIATIQPTFLKLIGCSKN